MYICTHSSRLKASQHLTMLQQSGEALQPAIAFRPSEELGHRYCMLDIAGKPAKFKTGLSSLLSFTRTPVPQGGPRT